VSIPEEHIRPAEGRNSNEDVREARVSFPEAATSNGLLARDSNDSIWSSVGAEGAGAGAGGDREANSNQFIGPQSKWDNIRKLTKARRWSNSMPQIKDMCAPAAVASSPLMAAAAVDEDKRWSLMIAALKVRRCRLT
jgi:hypothetical protein